MAWRMRHEIRKHMANVGGDPLLSGHTEVHETMTSGYQPGKRIHGAAGKTVILEMPERVGDVVTSFVRSARTETLERHILDHIRSDATISTDEWIDYRNLVRRGYRHGRSIIPATNGLMTCIIPIPSKASGLC